MAKTRPGATSLRNSRSHQASIHPHIQAELLEHPKPNQYAQFVPPPFPPLNATGAQYRDPLLPRLFAVLRCIDTTHSGKRSGLVISVSALLLDELLGENGVLVESCLGLITQSSSG